MKSVFQSEQLLDYRGGKIQAELNCIMWNKLTNYWIMFHCFSVWFIYYKLRDHFPADTTWAIEKKENVNLWIIHYNVVWEQELLSNTTDAYFQTEWVKVACQTCLTKNKRLCHHQNEDGIGHGTWNQTNQEKSETEINRAQAVALW